MKLLDICIGKTQELDINGQSVKTAYIKESISGLVRVNALGIEGNEVAVHTDAIYAFTQENYPYWADRLKVDQAQWSSGVFAENLLISGLQERDLRVGDIVAIGKDVQLSVSGPRIPCFKLCWRLRQPDTFISEFALSGKSGVYFNVEKTGQIRSGDTVKIIHKAKNSIGIVELAAIAFGKKDIDVQELQRILDLPGLSETSALFLRNKLYAIVDQEQLRRNRWQGWRAMKVVSVTNETPSIKSFVLRAADDKHLASYRAGQFLTVNLSPHTHGSLIRVWSLSNYQDDPDHYRLSIKKEPKGLGSGVMHDQIAVGSILEVQAPLGRFVLDRGSFKPVLLIAGGIGITPLLAMLKAHLGKGKKAPPIYFIHCCQNRVNQPFREELDQLGDDFDIPILHVYDQPSADDVLGRDYQVSGYLSIAHIDSLLDGCHIIHGGKKVYMPLADIDVYMCGPPVFQEKVYDALIAAGASASRVFQESFQVGISDKHADHVGNADVFFSASGKSVRWMAEDNLSLLELAESVGLSPPNACRMGVCQTCSTIIKEGSIYYDVTLTHPPEGNRALLCSAKPNSNYVVIDL